MAEPNPEEQAVTGQLSVQKIFLKDLSLECPNSPEVFGQAGQPQVDLQLSHEARALSEEQYEVVVKMTLTVAVEDKTAYLVEVHQAGIFQVAGFPQQHLGALLATACPNILFPFAREAVAWTVMHAGFPQMLLAPVNFEQLYLQEMQRRQQEQSAQPGSGDDKTVN